MPYPGDGMPIGEFEEPDDELENSVEIPEIPRPSDPVRVRHPTPAFLRRSGPNSVKPRKLPRKLPRKFRKPAAISVPHQDGRFAQLLLSAAIVLLGIWSLVVLSGFLLILVVPALLVCLLLMWVPVGHSSPAPTTN
jgi:hypothetical protein